MSLSSLLLGLMGVVVVTGAGCDGKCSGTYNCPAAIPSSTLSTTRLSSALVEVSADSPCTATLVPVDGGAPSVQVVDEAFNETLTCQVHGRLADGRTVTATISFQAVTTSCCAGFVASNAELVLTDAGTDGP